MRWRANSCSILVILLMLAVGQGALGATGGPPPRDQGKGLDERDQELLRAVERKYLQPGSEHRVVRYEGNTLIASDAYIDGDVVVLRGDVEIEGEVDGSVIAVRGDVRVSPGGTIRGDVVSVGGEVHSHHQAVVGGDIVETSIAAVRNSMRRGRRRGDFERWRSNRQWEPFNRRFWDEDQDVILLRYNRVEGPFAGVRLPRNFDPRREVADFGVYGLAGYGFKSKAWRFQIGGELSAFSGPPLKTPFLMTLGGEAHDLTDTQDRWIISEDENSLSAVLFKDDYMDFYRREGWSIYITQRIAGFLNLTGRFLSDDFTSLPNVTNWSLFGGNDFRLNPSVDDGRIQSFRGELRLDSRDSRSQPDRGWLITGLVESAGGEFGGQYQFQRYLLDVRRYQPVGFGDNLNFRLRAATAKDFLPRQYLYDLGGLSTLRGYGFKEFTGDRMLLGNVEYWVNADRRLDEVWFLGDLNLVLLFDAGLAWFAKDPSAPFRDFAHLGDRDFKTSTGLAIATDDGNFRIELVKPLGAEGRDVAVFLRASRPF